MTKSPLRIASRLAIAAAVVSLLGGGTASAHYIGPAYLMIPGVSGGAKVPQYKAWVRSEAHYWTERPEVFQLPENILDFSGPRAPRAGPSQLAVSIDKDSPAYKPMMDMCHESALLHEVIFAESSHLARNPLEQGPVPEDVPAHYEYTLKNVRPECPEAIGAREQAFVLRFEEIQWTNYTPRPGPFRVHANPAKLPPKPKGGKSKTYVLSWLSGLVEANKEQCPEMNRKPSQEHYYRYLSPERAAEQRVALVSRGGVDALLMAYRAPGELNITMLPGTVPDPGFAEPKADVVGGLNLDGDVGSGSPPRGIRKHRNFVAPWGEKGIDNQMFLIEGCVQGWHRTGMIPLSNNDRRHSGDLSIIIHISGIDNDRDDAHVTVDFLYSRDPMRRDSTGNVLLANYTYRVSDDISETQHFARFHGKIVDGIIVTEPIEKVNIHVTKVIGLPLWKPRMRLEMLPDGRMKGVLGGYRDWREYLGHAWRQKSQYEATIGYDSPGMYNALRRAADGLQDPLTGEYLGVSTAFELQGLESYLPPEHEESLAIAR